VKQLNLSSDHSSLQFYKEPGQSQNIIKVNMSIEESGLEGNHVLLYKKNGGAHRKF